MRATFSLPSRDFHWAGREKAGPDLFDYLHPEVRRETASGQAIRLSACDPLNLTGIITPGARVPAMLGQWVSYRDGVPAAAEGREARLSESSTAKA